MKELEELLKNRKDILSNENLPFTHHEKIIGDVAGGSFVMITWNDRESPDYGYIFELPGVTNADEGDVFVHIPKPNNEDGMDEVPPVFKHIDEISILDRVVSIECLEYNAVKRYLATNVSEINVTQYPSLFADILKEEFLINTENYPKEYHRLFAEKFKRAEDIYNSSNAKVAGMSQPTFTCSNCGEQLHEQATVTHVCPPAKDNCMQVVKECPECHKPIINGEHKCTRNQ